MPSNTTAVRALLDAIGKVEAGSAGYNAIYLPAAKKLGPYKLTSMTIKEVQALQASMVKGGAASTAVGRYQFIRKTLAALVKKLGISSGARFNEALQDRFAVRLLEDRGLKRFVAGRLSREAFANNLAKEWASLPVVTPINGKKVGQSYYAGDGLNHALVKPAKILALVDGLKAVPKPVARPVAAPKPAIPAAVPIEPKPAPELADVLMVGSKGPRVQALQQELSRLNYHPGGHDGIYGNLTRDAVMAFQADNSIDTDGMAGEQTWAALKVAKPRPLMAERKSDTLKDLVGKGSEIADGAEKGKKGAIATIVAGASTVAGKVVESAGGLANVGPVLTPYKDFLSEYGIWFFGSVVVAAGVFFFWQSRRIGKARLEDHRDAKTL